MKILVTGCAGFIGYHLSKRLIETDNIVYGIDNLNNYYSKSLKKKRLKNLLKHKKFFFNKVDLLEKNKLETIFKKKFDLVINLAAQAGVQFSFKKPEKYIDTNVLGFFNILELSKKYKINKLMFASSSSVYGSIKNKKFNETLKVDSQISLYATTKKMNETLAKYYSENYKINIYGLRFFTVYGPYGRPDMSYFKFSDLIHKNKKIELYNNGKHSRDFTYIDDAIKIVIKLIKKIKKREKNNFFEIFNIACGKKINLKTLISELKKNYNKKIFVKFKPMQKGDVKNTLSDTKKLKKKIGNFYPTRFSSGIKNFCDWYKNEYL